MLITLQVLSLNAQHVYSRQARLVRATSLRSNISSTRASAGRWCIGEERNAVHDRVQIRQKEYVSPRRRAYLLSFRER